MVEWLRAIGLMSGTSMDGVDVAVIETDGERIGWRGPARTLPYPDALRARLDSAVRAGERSTGNVALEADLTEAHAAATLAFIAELPTERRRVELVGFHGHTL